MSYENLCMNCMKEKGSAEQCPHCHFHNDSLQLPPFLPMRTMVGGHYIIGAVTESNGDGTTYMGYDTENKTPVTIREFLPEFMIPRKIKRMEELPHLPNGKIDRKQIREIMG